MRKDDSSDSGLAARLADPAEARALVGLGFDFVMARPLERFVTPEQVLAHLDEALRPAHLERVLTEHVRPSWDRDLERAGERGDRLEDYLTAQARELIGRLMAEPVRLDPRLLEGLVKQEAIRHLVQVIVEETISRFVQMLKPGGANGPLSKGIFARLGAQMEAQLQRAAGVFVSTSLDFLLKRLAQVLASPETEKQLGRLRRQGFDAGLKLRTETLWKIAHQLPLDDLLALVPALVKHNLGRTELREAILAEAASALEIEGARPLSEVLEPEALALWRERVVDVASPLLSELVETPELLAWLARA